MSNPLNKTVREPQASPRSRGPDRRKRPTPLFSRYWLIGRRRGGRRGREQDNQYVDRYSRGELFLVIGILVLSVLDMVFTLRHLNMGGAEANPVMAWTLEWGGHGAFKAFKLATTVIGLLVLLLHVRFRKVKSLLAVAFVLYSAVFVFHMYLLVLSTHPELVT